MSLGGVRLYFHIRTVQHHLIHTRRGKHSPLATIQTRSSTARRDYEVWQTIVNFPIPTFGTHRHPWGIRLEPPLTRPKQKAVPMRSPSSLAPGHRSIWAGPRRSYPSRPPACDPTASKVANPQMPIKLCQRRRRSVGSRPYSQRCQKEELRRWPVCMCPVCGVPCVSHDGKIPRCPAS
ncbi:uncharacterized protein K460DRAFT_88447 [Cucurbitaria berberidis CBS 394.84]|uniref:Uncharacterized protein n=1 Tax=Cucurbitaria berberidis CBS 394.84 TaxID=1168544 RepID=A0A9P4GQ60_9PLEO|nr:uncharacterized protein K460DRAFT_88447 [Cucurbitaria berberidis CBS 394.84]KAF1849294.1 hypothetical protein K460DRAFT_88447 [Cucurbitaria berberidis CBS 394.84]